MGKQGSVYTALIKRKDPEIHEVNCIQFIAHVSATRVLYLAPGARDYMQGYIAIHLLVTFNHRLGIQIASLLNMKSQKWVVLVSWPSCHFVLNHTLVSHTARCAAKQSPPYA